ncbi:sensor domain-containing diguanylate cyclase [Marinomonas algarum]|uniref:diguanylate cyclase n=1 Tax=Marinomonas algarum TaxID=2883105 RepID=A0A9X1IMX0_9GAMM|nr:diguanylate cyclase [Marinomonas algarum]MCB5161749.1 sensor domain-containing diguanylate cyclase [Marinomonas algarum]
MGKSLVINIREKPCLQTLLIFLCWAFSTVVCAALPVVPIAQDFTKLEQFQMGYFVDNTGQMSFSNVQQSDFTESPNSISLGTKAKTTWIQIRLKNTSQFPKTIFLHHPYAYHNRAVGLYEVVNNTLVRERYLDMDDKSTQEWMYRGSAVFDVDLQPNQTKTLFVQSLSFSHQWLALNLYNEEKSKRALLGQYTDIALLVGMLLALIIYNVLLFLSSRLKEHFYYSCYLISGGFWIALSYGLLADLFDVFGSVTLKWHLTLVSMPIFLLLFMINIFETKKKYPIEHWALMSVLIMLIIDFVYGLFDIVTALRYSSILAGLMMIVSLSVTVSMMIRKHPIAPFFLMAHGLFIAFSTLALLFYVGKAEFNYINSHGVGIGIVLEALALSLIIAYRIKNLETIKASQDELKLLASTDPMTRLYNRRYFNAEAELLLRQAVLRQQPATIVLLDIDHFKKVNDTYGHSAGDNVIIRVANTLTDQCRKQDILARYGGEEFIIFMTNTPVNQALPLMENIRRTLEQESVETGYDETIHFTVSAGIAEVDLGNPNLKNSINQADKALYQAKGFGRNQSKIYENK